MRRIIKNIFLSLLFVPVLLIIFNSYANGNGTAGSGFAPEHWLNVKDTIVDDTTKLKYPFKDYDDPYTKRDQNSPMYLNNPSNIKTEVEYDPVNGEYVVKEKVGDFDIRPSSHMSSAEFRKYTQTSSISDYWVEQRKANSRGSANESFLDKYLNPKLNVNIKGFDKIFGSNVIDIKPQGSAELIFGVNISKIENPTLPLNLQRSTTFDFDMKIQMGVTGKIGEKMKVGINYNTEAQFDFENQTTISYTGDEDEIIQSIEAGNVSLPLTGTLITGSQSLFGIKTALQFGKLRVTSIISQQKSESSTIVVEGGAQTSDFEFSADEYEAKKHFFLSHYFKDNYDKALQNLPIVSSSVTITKIEVWVTNKTGNYDNSRNIIGFVDLAESQANIYNTANVHQTGGGNYPSNDMNDLYSQMNSNPSIRDINQISSTLNDASGFSPIIDYAKVENARLLSSDEYILNSQLGYISLNSTLNDDEVLAVAYEYTVAGRTYKVGEFSTGGISAPSTLILKLIKGTSLKPSLPTWDLMMKNVYSIGSYQINSEDFTLNILYNNDQTGTTVNYIDAGAITGIPLLKVMGLDQLNSTQDAQPDGYFDFIDKLTINASNGRIIFPVREPFGSHLRSKINDAVLSDKYVFEELYDSTQSKAKQITEKSKFILKGSYKSSGGADISLNAFNIPEGSVKASANGVELVEGTDYVVDYNLGRVTILNQGLLESSTPIKISLENNSLFNINRRTLLGTHLDYVISDNFSLGGTILHLSEKPLTNKVNIGNEPISNTIWGIDGRYSTESPFLTKIIDALPFIETKEMSSIEVSGEFAQLIPGHSKTIGESGNAYIDDFEGTKTSIDLKAQYTWVLASTPQNQSNIFPEGNLTNDLAYGFNRAKLAWYNVNSDLVSSKGATPSNITVDDQSNHFVREVYEKEIFPNKESINNYPTILSIFNVVFYPNEKGPYNYDVASTGYSSGINSDGTLIDPESRWGGIMREIQTNDFEAANIEYIEFWMMDPFIYEPDHNGGDLYFNLGYISEDVLRDGRKGFENGLPTSANDTTLVDETVWGRVPVQQSLVNAFDDNANTRAYQDVGFDGLSDNQEASFFQNYLNSIATIFPGSEAYNKAVDDPSNDNYHFFRGSDYDSDPDLSILDRYKMYNGPDGNSPTASQSPESYSTSATLLPDVEDINQDNTLNEEEAYFQYKISLRPEDMNEVGENFISDIIETSVTLNNKETETVKWYQFKIPIKDYEKSCGAISDFSSIRFVRMFMRGFNDTIVTRFAKLDLVRSDWRNYQGNLTQGSESTGTPQYDEEGFDISVVSIEENGSRTPINYVLPPGITRVTDPTNPYLVQLNEQSLEFKVTDLNDGDSRAAYKNVNLDMRQYKKLQMEVHGEAIEDNTLEDDELTVFLRIGSDYKENFYEVEIPLKLTEPGKYNNDDDEDRKTVWPEENRFDFELEALQLVKQHRNNLIRQTNDNSLLTKAFSETPTDLMKITIIGNPNLSNVKTIMLGVRNPSRENNTNVDFGDPKSAIVWLNELRLTDFREEGGWAANGLVKTKLADLGSVTVAANTSKHGFGSLDSKIEDRQKEDIFQYDVSSNIELGKFFPAKHHVRIPVYFGFSENFTTPEYNPLDPDILLKTTLNDPEISQEEKDSIKRIVVDYTMRKSFNVTNLKIEGDPEKLKGKKKRFYHISNFSLSFAYNELLSRNVKTEYNIQRNYAGSFAYVFNNKPKAFEPFKNIKFLRKKAFQIIKDINIFLEPTMVSFRTDITRKYQQTKLRDITGENSIIEPTYSKDFIWNRNYDVKYSLTKGIKIEFSAANKSRIDEPEGVMDKNDQSYSAKRDSIWQNILDLGRNLNYNHVINASYNIPINKLPLLRWTSATARYKATYEWETGPTTADTINIGNTISNSNTINFNGTLNFAKVYDKVPFLKNISDKMKKGNKNKKYKEVKYTREKVKLKKDIGKSITHNLLTEDVQIKVTDETGKEVKGELIVVNGNKVKFKASDNYDNTSVEITGKKEVKDNIFKTLGEGIVNMAIGLKNVSLTYSETSGTILPGYLPSTKYVGLGQDGNGNWAPGIPFILGWQNDSMAINAYNNGWITTDSLMTSPYQMTFSSNIGIKATLEPLKGLKIDLSATKTISKNRSEYIFNNGAEKLYTGNFSMSYIMINTSFWKFNNDYTSKAFENFKSYRQEIAWRIANKRDQARLSASPSYDINAPNLDPITGDTLNTGYPNGYGPTSQEVMLPAFLAAYSGQSPGKVSLSAFPKIPLPNWRITYDGLSEIDLVKRIIKTISLSHSYTATYNLGSYTTNADYNWYDVNYDGYSWARNEANNYFIPEQEISSITLTESFNPLISADITWINNLNSKFEFNKGRSMTLSFANNQVTDLISTEMIIGLGYRFEQLPIVIKTGRGNQQKFQSDLNLRGDLSILDMTTIIRRIEENQNQPSAGQKAMSLKLTADYALNERFNVKFYYDHAITTPRISTSYRTSNIKFGVSVRFSLIPN